MLRTAVILSVFGHVALVWAMVRLPSAPTKPPQQLVEMDLFHEEKKAPPLVEPLKAPPLPLAAAPRARQTVAMAEPKVVPIAPMTTAPAETAPGSSQAVAPPRDLSKVDLSLHHDMLPQSPTAPPVGTVTAKVPWHPRGDAGDPILGKLPDLKTDAFPLESLGKDGFIYKGPNFNARIAMDGTVHFEDKALGFAKGSLGGSFDLTDIVMKRRHEDPYRYQKEKFMDATSKKREELQKRAHAERMQTALAELPWSCDRIWQDRTRTASQRRRELYDLWRDTEADGDPKMTAEARKVIAQYIQRYLPEDSVNAYTDSELAAFNAKGGPRFNPYE